MHPEALTQLIDDQLFQEHPDLLQLDIELNRQAEMVMRPGRGPDSECDPYRADAYVDHLKDALQEPAGAPAEPPTHGGRHERDGHEQDQAHSNSEIHRSHAEHGDHPPGCHCEAHGYKEVGQNNHIEGHKHNPDGSCCGKLPGEAKADIDTPASRHKVHTEADPENAGAKHVDHENHRHEAGEYSGECHCASCNPNEAKQHIETSDCASGNCGHEHHSKVGPTRDQERQHDYSRIFKEQIPESHSHKAHAHKHANHDEHYQLDLSATEVPKPEEIARHAAHGHEAAHARQYETETVETVAPEEQHRHQAIEVTEAAASDTTSPAERAIEQAPDATVAPSVQQELAQPLAVEGSYEATLTPVETAVASRKPEANTTQWLDDIQDTHEAPAELVETYSEPILETEMIVAASELVAPDAVEAELVMLDLNEIEPIEAPTLSANALVMETDSVQEAQETEASPAASVEQALSATQEVTITKTSERTLTEPRTRIAKEIPEFAAIEEQFMALTEIAADRTPEVLNELRKSTADLYAALHDDTSEVSNEKVSQEFLRLLTLLGFEHPGETLRMYMQRYGISMMNDMLARLFELLRQSRSMETVTPTTPLFMALPPDSQGTQTIGKTVLALLTKLHGVQRQELALVA